MKLVTGLAVACSGAAILACLIAVPCIYRDITSLYEEIMLDMEQFKVGVDLFEVKAVLMHE